jgi:hypothetical protein
MDDDATAAVLHKLQSAGVDSSGRRRLPVLRSSEVVLVAEATHREIDDTTAARAVAARQQGIVIACGHGCSACCENMVIVLEPEALAVAAWLARPDNQMAREVFFRRYREWRAAIGDAPARAVDLVARRQPLEPLLGEIWRKRVMCAFNQDGSCTIYSVRPNTCRLAHAVDTNVHCAGDDASGVPARLMSFAPVDAVLQRTNRLLLMSHLAVEGSRGGPPEALCAAVHRLLVAQLRIGRNAPCPCGSGSKHKQCCGGH